MKTRATVWLNSVDPETEFGLLRESAHEEDYSAGEVGVALSRADGSHAFMPWAAILKVDFWPCECAECVGNLTP